ncbi:MAG TPA: hypothetical protein VL527_14300 [Dongiaceae bacterium]|nr:hypothetical protein [Dongiaceae bacterium]
MVLRCVKPAACGSSLMAALWLTAAAHAGVVFYTVPANFNAAAAPYTLLGTEDWSSATGTNIADVTDPLLPGVANGPFPTGSKPATGVQAQSNANGANADNLNPGDGMFYSPTGYSGFSGHIQPSQQLSVNQTGDSFDVIFGDTNNPSNVKAVSLSPMFYQLGASSSGNITIRVYNQANVFLDTTTVSNVQDSLENAYLGIIATNNSDTIGRINLWASSQDASGADNIAVYAGTTSPVTLHADGWATNSFTFTLTGNPGSSYVIQSSSNLVNWTSLQTNQLSSNSLQLKISAPARAQMYRAQLAQ